MQNPICLDELTQVGQTFCLQPADLRRCLNCSGHVSTAHCVDCSNEAGLFSIYSSLQRENKLIILHNSSVCKCSLVNILGN